MRFLLVLLAVLITAGSARANVLIYRGSARAALPSATSQFSRVPRVFLVIDRTSNKGYFVFYFTLAGKKDSLNLLPLDNVRYVAQAISTARTVGTFSFVLDNSAGSDVGVNMFYFRGNETTLKLSTNGNGTFGNYPRVLGGIFREVQKFGQTPSLFELNFTLSFDAAHTQFQNNSGHDGPAAVTDLNNELSLKGY